MISGGDWIALRQNRECGKIAVGRFSLLQTTIAYALLHISSADSMQLKMQSGAGSACSSLDQSLSRQITLFVIDMNTRSEDYYLVRQRTSAHNTTLANASGTSRTVIEIIKKVYDHQPAIYRGKSRKLNAGDATESVASHFYANCYVTPNITRGTTDAGHPVTVDEFQEEIIHKPRNISNRNDLFYLVGEVGSGKTAFINYLISEYGHKWPSKSVWFLRLDVEAASDGSSLETTTLMRELIRKSARLFQEFPEILCGNEQAEGSASAKSALSSLVETFNKSESTATFPALCELFTHFVSKVHRAVGRTPVLFFDNLDYIAHLSDRELFTEEGAKNDSATLKTMHSLIKAFFHEGEALGRLGASILFVMRPDTYEMVSLSGSTSRREPSLTHDQSAYSLHAPNWSDVLDAKTSLLESVISKNNTPGVSAELSKFVSILNNECSRKDTESGFTLLEHIQSVSNHGLRDLMLFLMQYSWIRGASHADAWTMIERMGSQHPIALMTLMLGGRCRFSQVLSSFPNIYLVNSPTYQHEHTYWLKRLIIAFIYERERRNETTTPLQVEAVFSGDGGYPHRLVQTCLGSLATANSSNLIRARRSENPSGSYMIEEITTTPRCKHCVKHIFDKFMYLQLVVDDFSIPVPRLLNGTFAFGISEPDYSYFTQFDQQAFGTQAKQMIDIKARRVYSFLLVLCSSFDIERAKYARVFKSLHAQKIVLPEPQTMRVNLLYELNAIRRWLGIATTVEGYSGLPSLETTIDYLKEAYGP